MNRQGNRGASSGSVSGISPKPSALSGTGPRHRSESSLQGHPSKPDRAAAMRSGGSRRGGGACGAGADALARRCCGAAGGSVAASPWPREVVRGGGEALFEAGSPQAPDCISISAGISADLGPAEPQTAWRISISATTAGFPAVVAPGWRCSGAS